MFVAKGATCLRKFVKDIARAVANGRGGHSIHGPQLIHDGAHEECSGSQQRFDGNIIMILSKSWDIHPDSGGAQSHRRYPHTMEGGSRCEGID